MKKILDELFFANIKKNASIKFLLIMVGVLLAFTMSVTAQTTFPSGCNSIKKTSGGSTVQFIGVTYTGTGVNIKSTYTYKVTSGCSPNISHFNFGGLNCPTCMNSSSDFSSVSASGAYSFGTDPTTGICGIKYDYDIACNGSNTVSFTLNGYYGVGTIRFALKAGQNLEYADICGPDCTKPNLSLGNFVWYDANNNGIQDTGETGINGASVNLYADANGDNIADAGVLQTVTTNPAGLYKFTNLLPGKYIVGVIIPSGYLPSATTTTSATPDNDINTDNNGIRTVDGELRSNFITITTYGEPINDGDDSNGNLTLDFGLRGTGSIGDFVFNDANGNGLQDAGEVGIPNVTVTLTNINNGVSATTITDVNGLYSFPNLAPSANYTVAFTTPTGFTATLTKAGTDITKDSDPKDGTVTGVTVVAGLANNTIDAGFFVTKITIAISGNVWHDVNGLLNGTINNTSGAVPIPSALNIYLINNATGKIEQSNIVANNGVFTFLNVNINTSYRILYSTIYSFPGDNAPNVLLPSGWYKVGENLGAGPGTDGVIDGILFIQTETQNILNANFGIQVKLGEVVIG